MKKYALFFMAIVILSGCSFQTKQRGYIFPSDLDEQVKTIKNTNQLEDSFGSPQIKTIHGNEVWVYYSVDENTRGPMAMKYDNKTVLLAWVRGENVEKIQVLRDEDLETVHPDRNETDVPAAIELNAIEELFNNIGRFSPAGLGQ